MTSDSLGVVGPGADHEVFLFGYGSLVSAASIGHTLGFDVPAGSGPIPAVLQGWQRQWNAGSDRTSHPERVMLEESGAEFTGTMAVLGIASVAGARCTGAVYRLRACDVGRLIDRERNYRLQDVSDAVTWPGRPDDVPVLTFVPHEAALKRLATAERRGTAVIRREYAELVDSAFRSLGPDRYEEFQAGTAPTRLERRPLTRADDVLP